MLLYSILIINPPEIEGNPSISFDDVGPLKNTTACEAKDMIISDWKTWAKANINQQQ